jgi:signal transduction histidine kinase
MNKDIFHSASLKLTALYLIIIMLISMIFSFGFYNVASHELERSLKKDLGPIGQLFISNSYGYVQDVGLEQDLAVQEAHSRLKANLILINLFILMGGGLLSYYLARRTLRPIEEVHEAQSRFTADASHELRTPISAMRLETEIALMDDGLTLMQAKKQLQSNIEELDKLTSLSEGLLQLSRLDNDEIVKENTTIKQVIKPAIERVDKKAKIKKQKIIVKKFTDIEIFANPSSVIEALVTFLDNAVTYSPEKSEIIVSLRKIKNTVSIDITDHGVGIKTEDIPYIFDRFYRADNSRTKENEKGYGIGLSIAKSVAEAHNGNVSVISKPGKGSTFTLSLPIK